MILRPSKMSMTRCTDAVEDSMTVLHPAEREESGTFHDLISWLCQQLHCNKSVLLQLTVNYKYCKFSIILEYQNKNDTRKYTGLSIFVLFICVKYQLFQQN